MGANLLVEGKHKAMTVCEASLGGRHLAHGDGATADA